MGLGRLALDQHVQAGHAGRDDKDRAQIVGQGGQARSGLEQQLGDQPDHAGKGQGDAEAQQRLITLVERSVDKVCTVGRTLKAGTKVTLSFDTEA